MHQGKRKVIIEPNMQSYAFSHSKEQLPLGAREPGPEGDPTTGDWVAGRKASAWGRKPSWETEPEASYSVHPGGATYLTGVRQGQRQAHLQLSSGKD